MSGTTIPTSPRPVEQRVAALESLLVERGLVTTDAIDAVVAHLRATTSDRMNGAAVVARAWTDPGYQDRLLTTRTPAIGELGFGGAEGENMVVAREHRRRPQRRRVHAVLLLPVARARPAAPLVQERRLPVRARCASRARSWPSSARSCPTTSRSGCWDSSAELRYLVLPNARPAPTT